MTPAINAIKKSNTVFIQQEYTHDVNTVSYGLEAIEKLALPAEQVLKTLVVKLDQTKLIVAILPVLDKLNLKAVAKAYACKKAELAEQQEVQRSTGYVLGGVSPLGQKKVLPTLIEQSVMLQKTVYVSGGRRGLEIGLAPKDLQQLTHATCHSICQ